jgi:L-arabinonolactonase
LAFRVLEVNPLHILDVKNLLGEGVLWDGRIQSAIWTDIESSKLWLWQPGCDPESFSLPQRLGSVALTETPGSYLGAFEQGFARFTPATGAFEMCAAVTADHQHLRMNDGRVDRTGTFWAGSMAEKDGKPLGSLWRYDGAGKVTPFFGDVRIPNSLCWNRDGTRMYFADSPRNMIWRYAFDPVLGPVGAPDVFATTLSGVHPDGSCIDAEDHLWNAQWGAGEIVRYRPDGSVERRLKLPVSQPSCVAFGGAHLDQLFVTTARVDLCPEQLDSEPLAGALLVYDVGVKGLPEVQAR